MSHDFTNLLSTEQKIRLGLYQAFKDDAEKAYDFIMQSAQVTPTQWMPLPEAPTNDDGIYFIDEYGRAIKFNDSESETPRDTSYITHIGIIDGPRSLKVSVKSFEAQVQDYNFERDSIKDFSGYIKCELDALMDWDGEKNTKHILTQCPALKNELKEGEYIPSLGQLAFIWHHRHQINKALNVIGYNPLSWRTIWSSTEYDAVNGWNVDFTNGSVYYDRKDLTYTVRAVADFYLA